MREALSRTCEGGRGRVRSRGPLTRIGDVAGAWPSGRRLTLDQEVPGSNPGAPANDTRYGARGHDGGDTWSGVWWPHVLPCRTWSVSDPRASTAGERHPAAGSRGERGRHHDRLARAVAVVIEGHGQRGRSASAVRGREGSAGAATRPPPAGGRAAFRASCRGTDRLSALYLDSSAFVKLAVTEPESRRCDRSCRAGRPSLVRQAAHGLLARGASANQALAGPRPNEPMADQPSGDRLHRLDPRLAREARLSAGHRWLPLPRWSSTTSE